MGVFSIIVQTVSLAELANSSWFRQAACAGDPLSLPSECWDFFHVFYHICSAFYVGAGDTNSA